MSDYIEIPYIKITQPIGEFYICSIKWDELLQIAKADIRQIDKESENGGFDSYLGIQRNLSPTRVKEISQYVKTIDATFPTSIILHANSKNHLLEGKEVSRFSPDYIDSNLDKIEVVENVKIIEKSNILKIRKDGKVAQILDGQHRIEGLRALFEKNEGSLFPEKVEKFDLNVTIFIDLDIDDQAQIFSVINKAQTKVNKSLVYDLYEYAKHRSPQKSSHDIVRLLNRMESSPFFLKIKILGMASNVERETIAQATLVELIMSYISQNPMEDRDILRGGRLFGKNKLSKLENIKEIEKYVFRNLFIDNKDEVIFQTIFNFFKVVDHKWPVSWRENVEGNILNKSTGLIALMRFMRNVINKIGTYEEVIEQDVFRSILDRVELKDESFTKDKYVPGSSGQGKLFRELMSFIECKV